MSKRRGIVGKSAGPEAATGRSAVQNCNGMLDGCTGRDPDAIMSVLTILGMKTVVLYRPGSGY